MNETGLTSKEVEALIRQGKINQIPQEETRSIKKIVFSNVFTYFNAIFVVLAVMLIITGSFKNLAFMMVAISNTAVGIIQQLRAKKVLDDLALLDITEYITIRDGEEIKVKSDRLVLGDLIRLESGQQIPADAIVVSGEAGVNESLLTGEAKEVEKKPGSELMSGSFVTAGMMTAKLTYVGADSYAARLTAKAKEEKESQSEMIRDIERIVRIAGILIIPVGGVLLYQGMCVNGLSAREAVTSMVGAVTGMIPQGLYLLVTAALALSAVRLAKNKVLLHDMRSIETLARVDVLCVDKTGTITSNVMEVSELLAPAGKSDEDIATARELLTGYIRTVPDNNSTMKAMRSYLPQTESLDNLSVTGFSSKTKHSEVVTAQGTYRLGAPEYLLCEADMENNRALIEERAATGQRVLAMTKDSVPVLFVVLKNEVRQNAKETFTGFARQGVSVKVISGDNPLTVSRVAEEAGIENADRYVDATVLDTPDKLSKAAAEYTVFGRVKPEQKKALVDALQEQGLKVAMTGDGVNDILAMKGADCSIAMGTGSDAARQAAQVVLLDSDFSHMKQIVSEGRRDINNITRSATLFLYKNIFSLLLAVFSICTGFSYPLHPTQISLFSMFTIGVPASLLALEPNDHKQQGRFIRRTLIGATPPALTSFIAISVMVVLGNLFELSASDVGTASTYLMAVVGYLTVWGICRPMNRWRITVFVVCVAGFLFCNQYLSFIFEVGKLSKEAAVLCAIMTVAELPVIRAFTLIALWIDSRSDISCRKAIPAGQN